MKIFKSFGIASLTQIAIYFLQYIIIPLIYTPSPMNQSATLIVMLITTIPIVCISRCAFFLKIGYLAISIVCYPILVFTYHPNNIYGIGYDGYFISFGEDFDIMVFTIVLFIVEIITLFVLSILRFLMTKYRKNDSNLP